MERACGLERKVLRLGLTLSIVLESSCLSTLSRKMAAAQEAARSAHYGGAQQQCNRA